MEVVMQDIVLSRESSQYIDRWAPQVIGMPLAWLMENAGRGLAEALMEKANLQKTILFVCGTGNNGADALVAARHLQEAGHSVLLYVYGNPDKGTDLWKEQFCLVEALDLPIVTSRDAIAWHTIGTLVEGLIGTGLMGDLREEMSAELDTIQAIVEDYGIDLWAIDIPAGLDATTGYVGPHTMTYDYTVTFGANKQGLLLYPGKKYAGQVLVKGLGLPWQRAKKNYFQTYRISKSLIQSILQARPGDGHKGTFGHVLVVGGHQGMAGAPIMAGNASVRGGAGKTTVAVPPEALTVAQCQLMPEVMTASFTSGDDINRLLATKDVLAMGPGLGRTNQATQVVLDVISNCHKPMVLDADALYALGEVGPDDVFPHAIMTPHLGEFSRLVHMSIEEIKRNYIELARQFACRHKVVLLLKGIPALVALPDGRIYIGSTGNSGMGTGGMGDALTGLVASLLAQGYSLEEAAVLGTYLHGAAADDLSQSRQWGYTPTEVASHVSYIITQVLRNQ